MVKVGFIVEGATEKIILERSDFFQYLRGLGLDYIPDVIDAEGNGNLLPKNINQYSQILKSKGSTVIFILTDLDSDLCITSTKNRIQPLPDHIVVISIKQIESWFLSDTDAMRSYLKDSTYTHIDPESVSIPYEEIKRIRIMKNNMGPGGKTILANAMVRHNFSITKAANHPKCSSAKYFLNKLVELASQ